ncbi:thebaine 6-O-demethylase-like [Eucalyptus grandis]|uniref:thebaine 6-O-demethylase-like n=1 Tax=Eucalyptus grandis TaxID=71139 RepID=UPI00192EEBFB|nr:thebaine 6-O-demethylase-like [Eucalyptus grandis]
MVNVQLMNHGVLDEGMRMMKENVQGFFDLPPPREAKVSPKTRKSRRLRAGFRHLSRPEAAVERRDLPQMPSCSCEKSRSVAKNSPGIQSIRIALEKYIEDMRKLVAEVVKYIGMALGIHEGELDLLTKSFGEGKYEVLSKDNCWVTVPPVPGGIVVNLGQIMEVYSNATYRAPDHRSVVNKEKERVSIATFCYPSPSVPVGPSPSSSQPPDSPLSTKTLSNSGEFLQCFLSHKLDDAVPFIDTLKL